MTKEQLLEDAKTLGISVTGDESELELQASIEKAKAENAGAPKDPTDLKDDEIEKLNKKIEENLKDKKEEDNKPKYTQADLDAIVEKLSEKFSAAKDTDGSDIIDLLAPNFNQRRFVSVPRFEDKFVVGLEDVNTDSYSDKAVHIMNVENPNIKSNGTLDYIPMAKFMFEQIEGAEKIPSKLYPYLQFLDKSTWVWCEIVDRKETDTSEIFGTVEVNELTQDEWNMKSTGQRILSKAKRTHTVFVLKDIKDGHTFEVDEIVINKRIAPVESLKKFLEKK